MEKCLICNQEYSTYRGLAVHLNGSHGMSTKNYLDTYVYKGITPKCGQCGSDQSWNYRGRYEGCSIRCDRNDNYEECEICKLRCEDLSDLSIHVKIVHKLDFKDYLDTHVYKGITPVCKQCGLPMTYYKGRYKDHSDNCHLLHKCYICGEHYTLNHLLSRHVKSAHKINKFKDYLDNYVPGNPPKCSKCGADLAFEFGAYTDKCSKRCSSPLKCEICNMGCGNKESLGRHIKFAHKMETKYYVDKYVWNDSPPRCDTCGTIKVFNKGSYRDWCPKCSPYHTFQHCKRGWYESKKVLNNRFYYRSNHEYIACQLLDNDPNVRYFYKGPIILMDDGSDYLMDFYVIMTDNSTKLIEVKPKNNIMDELVQRKIQAASLYAKDNCIDEVIFWSESNLYSKGV